MKNLKHWASWGLMLCLTLGAYSAQAQAPQNPTAATGKPSKPSLTVTVALPKTEMVTQSIPANGTLAAWQEAIIGAEANGLRTTEVRVNVGDWVQRGALLALLQSDTLKAELAQAQASLGEANAAAQEAHAQAERVRTLHQQGFYSAAQLSQALATDASAQARVQSAKALVQLQTLRLSQTEIRAPDAGVISARLATVGGVVSPGVELFRLIRQGRLEWRAEVMPAEIARIRPGARAQITAASGQVLQGQVRMVAPSVDAQTRKAVVYVDVQGQPGSARAGMFAKGDIEWGQGQALTVPQTAVVVRDGFSYVYTVGTDQKVAQVKVATGRLVGERMQVLDGLKPDARVVVSGGAFLNHGDTVRVVDAASAKP
jgi:RND family efflux transporter MFP subunit